MADYYRNKEHLLTTPIRGAFSITPHDTNELSQYTRQIKVGGSGNLAVTWYDNSETTEAVEANVFYDWRIKKVKSTGTTATSIRGYY